MLKDDAQTRGRRTNARATAGTGGRADGNARLGDDGPCDLALHDLPARPLLGRHRRRVRRIAARRRSWSAHHLRAVKFSAFGIPGERATDIAVVLYAVPGALLGIALVYLEGMRRERAGERRPRRCVPVAAPARFCRAPAAVSAAVSGPAASRCPECRARGRAAPAARARRQRRARPGAGAPRARRAGARAAFLAGAEEHPPQAFAGIGDAVALIAALARGDADHDPRRLRRRRHLLDRGARARAARAGRRRRLLPAGPRERRLRAERGDRRAARRSAAPACW